MDNYRFQQMDGFLIRQLQISVKDQPKWASFQLITNDGYKSTPLHKWMLSARSPAFAALFSSNEDIRSLHLAVDCTIYQMNQMIQFIYTGKVIGQISHELMQLAAKYEIKTLEEICEAALQDDESMDKMAVIAWHLDSGCQMSCNEINE